MKIVSIKTGIYFIFDFPMMDVVFEKNGVQNVGTIVGELIDKVTNSRLPYLIEEVDKGNVEEKLF